MNESPLAVQVAETVVTACDDSLSVEAVLAEKDSLLAIGVTSLAFMRTIDALEAQFGVVLDIDRVMPETVDDFVTLLAAAGHPESAP